MTGRSLPTALPTLVLAGVAAALLGGCGSSATKTVSVSGAPAPATSAATRSPARTAPRTTPAPPTAGATTTSGADGAASAQTQSTRTAPEPAFTQHGGSSGEASGEQSAAAVVKSHGYTPNRVSEYHSDQTLTVLVGTRTGSADGYDQRAFFFLDGKYIGTDASASSASIRVLAQSDTEVTLAYPLYRAHDPLCCPSGGQATVHFQLNDGKLVPLQPIPPVASATGFGRQ